MPTTYVGTESAVDLQTIADILGKSKKVVVITGAGISTNCGIPDFRSENGLYSRIQAQYEAASLAPSTPKLPIEPDVKEPPTKRRRVTRSSSNLQSCISATEEAFSEASSQTSSQTSSQASSQASSQTSLDSCIMDVSKPKKRGWPKGKPRSLTKKTSLLRRASTASQPERTDTDDNETASLTRRTSLPNLKGKDLFDSRIWSDSLSTSIFLTFIASLRRQIITDVKGTTSTHKFIKILRDGGRLVRCYTQNIDGLEGREGLCSEITRGPGSRSRFSLSNLKQARDNKTGQGGSADGGCEVVELHGGLQYLRCELCQHLHAWDEELKAFSDEEEEEDRTWTNFEESLLAGQAPRCTKCSKSSADRRGKGRRSLAVGRLRPDIVLYGEEHPAAHLIAPIVTHDLSLNPDVLLILGTSLRVHGLKVMVREFAKAVHSRSGKVIFVNRTKPPDSIWGDIIDYWVENDCDSWVQDLQQRRDDMWLPQGSEALIKKKPEKPEKPPAKHPRAVRDNKENGAYLSFKVVEYLGRISGRLQAVVEPKAKAEKKRKRQSNEPTSDTVEKTTKSHNRSRMLTHDRLVGPHPRHELQFRHHRVQQPPPFGFMQPQPLSTRSSNIMSRRSQHADRYKLPPLRTDTSPSNWALAHSTVSTSLLPVVNNPRRHRHQTYREPCITTSQLPSRSTSATMSSPILPTQASLPLTPKAQRIKELGSINAILSSPLIGTPATARQQFGIWRAVSGIADLPASFLRKGVSSLWNRSHAQRDSEDLSSDL